MMLSIAEQTRKRKYNGETRVPRLMDLTDEDVKIGQRYYNHSEGLGECWRWRWLLPCQIDGISYMPGRKVNWVNSRYILPGGRCCMIVGIDYTLRSLNRDCLLVPSERAMVFNELGLSEDLLTEVMMFLGLDMNRICVIKPKKVRVGRSPDSRKSDSEE